MRLKKLSGNGESKFYKKHTVKTLNVSISDLEYNKFGITNDKLSFSDLIDLVSRELAKQNLDKSVALGEKYGLSKLTMDEINAEVKAVRKNA
jgi:hypothetical protein